MSSSGAPASFAGVTGAPVSAAPASSIDGPESGLPASGLSGAPHTPDEQTPARQSAFELHVPSPFARPHLSSFVSQTPAAQTRAPTVAEHVVTFDGDDGRWVPLASFGTQLPVALGAALHHSVALAQSES